ncbi:unnamed protein product [Candida verbasci]|uniref:Translin n=1 Tax=Candida verbasci TaxID=1227364 RepID=A0A9W4TWS7_9ASCO|nr:unnamed protein product [Candida verbasci]
MDQFFKEIKNQIETDFEKKSALQDLEHQFDVSIIPFKSKFNDKITILPNKLKSEENVSVFISEVVSNYEKFSKSVSELNAKFGQKERLQNKIVEESIYYLLISNYFQVLSNSYTNEVIRIQFVSEKENGIILTPEQVKSLLNFDKIDYQIYLISLLKLIEVIVEYTLNSVINQSIENESISSNYSISLINSQIVSKLQNGFQLLDLKNDILRKKYDSLKYNYQRLNKIVYDLTLRNLITTKIELL